MTPTIRNARPSDAEGLLEIYSWNVRHTAVSFEYVPPTVEAFRRRMATAMAKYPWLAAEAEGRLLGYACAGPFKAGYAHDRSRETAIYLDRAARGRVLVRHGLDGETHRGHEVGPVRNDLKES